MHHDSRWRHYSQKGLFVTTNFIYNFRFTPQKMGADASLPLSPVEPGFSMMSITFRDGDRVTVLHLNAAELSVVRQAIKDTWQPGIRAEQSRCGTGWSFKLNGYPFSSTSAKPSQQSREMVMQILKNLHGIGYQVLASGTLGTDKDRSTLFFKKSPSNLLVPQFFCVSFNDSDKIQFTNLPSQLADAIRDTIRTSWPFGIQSVDDQNGVLQFKLAGNPWTASNNEQSIQVQNASPGYFCCTPSLPVGLSCKCEP